MGRCEENSHRVFRPNQKVKKSIMVSTAGQAIDKTVYFFVHVYINKQGHLFLYGSCFKCRRNPILGSCIFQHSPHLESACRSRVVGSGYMPLLGDHSLQSLTLLSCSGPAMFRSVLGQKPLAFLLFFRTPTSSTQGPIAEVAARCCCSFDSDHNAS